MSSRYHDRENDKISVIRIYLPIIAAILLSSACCHGATEFNRNRFGVVFSAYVHDHVTSNNLQDDWSSYSLEDVKTMMKALSRNFSKILTTTAGARRVLGGYQKDSTYHQSFSQVYSAEAAALVNKEMNGTDGYTPISAYIGIQVYSQIKLLDLEINLALESVEKANVIFPDTVKGLVFNGDDIDSSISVASLTFEKLHEVREDANRLSLKLGTIQSCNGLGPSDNTHLAQIRKEVVEVSNSIICEFTFVDGPTPQGFADTVNEFSKYENHTRLINPEIEIMGKTGFPARTNNITELFDMRHRWRKASTLAENFKIDVWMMEAFDNPWRAGKDAHLGWWKLSDNSKTNSTDAYIEKMAVLETLEKTKIFNRDMDGGHGGNKVERKYPFSIGIAICIIILFHVWSNSVLI